MPTTERLRAALADRYVVEREIGSGGMATVYLAKDVKHDRDVALKVLRADLSAVIGAERFLSEIKIAARLDHPHILTLIDSGSADGILYYVLPYVRGDSLRARLVREKQLGIDEALSITRQVASALDYAHRQGVVHRDIKPENILFHEGEAVLADFGIALAVKEAGGNRLTETGLSLGTPQYMSPEQATGDRSIDGRSDVYSLAAVLYEMLTGEPPVSGATAQAMIAKLLTERPTSIRVVRDTVPPGVDTAVTKALAKVPADRFASAGDFARALDAATATKPDVAPARKRNVPLIAAGAAVLIAIAAWLGSRAGRSSPAAVTLTDRTQVTFYGRVRDPSISGDGKQIAYVVRNCRSTGCTYGIEMQDLGGIATRRVFDGASAMYGIEWSPDRRSLQFVASINGVYGTYLISTIGGAPRRISPAIATYWGSDSLSFVRVQQPHPDYWIYVAGLDGVASDSIRVAGGASEALEGFGAIPQSDKIVVRVREGTRSTWLSLDRAGRELARITTPSVNAMVVSADAIWMLMRSGASSQRPVVARIDYDGKTGRFGTRLDTVYRLASASNSFTVTADGSTILFDEGISEYDVWATDFRSAMRGDFPRDKSLLHSTSAPRATISLDGSRMLMGRTDGSAAGQWRWSVVPFGGGTESPLAIAGEETNVYWADSTTVGIAARTSGTWRLSLMDVRTGARSSMFTLPDPDYDDFTALGVGGWAWLPLGGRTLAIQPAGASTPRRIAIPSWYVSLMDVSASPDGSKIAFTGWSAPVGDSIGVSVLSVADGSETRWTSVFGEGGVARWLDDGSLLLAVQSTNDTYLLRRLRGPGNVEVLGTVPRSLTQLSVSRDLQRMSIVGRDDHGDAWTMRVVRR